MITKNKIDYDRQVKFSSKNIERDTPPRPPKQKHIKHRAKSSKIKIGRLLFAGILTAVVFFGGFVMARALTTDTKLSAEKTLVLNDGITFDDIAMPDYGGLAIAIDGEVVAGKNQDVVRPTASTAKMITGLAIMKARPFNIGEKGETIAIDNYAYERYAWYLQNNGSNTMVQLGEEISEYDALVSMFLASSNNMADTLAVWAFGSMDAYREYAQKMLAELGLTHTTIGEDASGFSETTVSTAGDLAALGRMVLMEPVLSEIVDMREYEVPVAGEITNTNQLLGELGIVGVKTGYIGEASGYCLVSGYREGEHIITLALTGAPTREDSFASSREIVESLQNALTLTTLVEAGEVVGYYDTWWAGKVPIKASRELDALNWAGATKSSELIMDGKSGDLVVKISSDVHTVPVGTGDFATEPSFMDRIKHVFGWKNEAGADNYSGETSEMSAPKPPADEASDIAISSPEPSATSPGETTDISQVVDLSFTAAPSNNPTIKYGRLMLINPNFMVEPEFIAARRGELISLAGTYGIQELNAYNGDNLLDAEAGKALSQMLADYTLANPGHEMQTVSCFRSVGTTCGRLCAATGASDHHTGLTCDLIDSTYGTELNTDYYNNHVEWQWLRNNSYRYGFIDRFPEAWAGGSMDEPLNVDENGSTGLYETWHYRYVGVEAATDIATGKYNGGAYDSLEHYLKARGLVTDLKNGN